jgi:glutathione synthase/RimK-type ligase-like ATP-grasp enzyme
MLCLIGPAGDAEIQSVAARLRQRQASFSIWDPVSLDGIAAELRPTEHRHEPLKSAPRTVVYLRNLAADPRDDRYSAELDSRPYALLSRLAERRGMILSWLKLLEHDGACIINPLVTQSVHAVKPWQLATLSRAGLDVPDTVVTTRADVVQKFAAKHPEVVFKPVAGGGYARVLEQGDLSEERLALLRNAPVQFQERIVGDNVRAYVVAGCVVAAARIDCEAIDYRVAPHRLEAIELPSVVARAASIAAECLGLVFAGVDLIVSPERIVVLEANPSPMFARFDERTGSRVGSMLADFMIARAAMLGASLGDSGVRARAAL